MNASISIIFGMPVYMANILQSEGLEIGHLLKECREIREKVPGKGISNVGGYHSEIRRLGDNWLSALEGPLILHYERYLQAAFNVNPSEPPPLEIDAWVNVNTGTNANTVHEHTPSGCCFSAVFYVQAEIEGSGRLILEDLMYPHPRMRANPQQPFSRIPMFDQCHSKHFIEPSSGLLVIFPASLFHSVEPTMEEAERISIAANLYDRRARFTISEYPRTTPLFQN